MISHLEGRLISKTPTLLLVDVGGVGFSVHIPLSSYEAIAEVGARVHVLTHLHVREDAMALYGFATEAERDAFELLISVSGIGPPMARTILSGVPVHDLGRMVSTEDVPGLTRIKGVGQKLAQRMVVELKERFDKIGLEDWEGGPEGEALDRVNEATAALVGLGSSPIQARKVVVDVIRADGDDLPIEEIIRRALRKT